MDETEGNYKERCKMLGYEVNELRNERFHLRNKLGRLKKNYRGMQRNLELERTKRKLAESERDYLATHLAADTLLNLKVGTR